MTRLLPIGRTPERDECLTQRERLTLRHVHCKDSAWHNGCPRAAVTNAVDCHEWRADGGLPADGPRATE